MGRAWLREDPGLGGGDPGEEGQGWIMRNLEQQQPSGEGEDGPH